MIILDQISDPGNLGTIVRTCAWFGVKSIILSKNLTNVLEASFKALIDSLDYKLYKEKAPASSQ